MAQGKLYLVYIRFFRQLRITELCRKANLILPYRLCLVSFQGLCLVVLCITTMSIELHVFLHLSSDLFCSISVAASGCLSLFCQPVGFSLCFVMVLVLCKLWRTYLWFLVCHLLADFFSSLKYVIVESEVVHFCNAECHGASLSCKAPLICRLDVGSGCFHLGSDRTIHIYGWYMVCILQYHPYVWCVCIRFSPTIRWSKMRISDLGPRIVIGLFFVCH